MDALSRQHGVLSFSTTPVRLPRLTIGLLAVTGISLLGFLLVPRGPSKEVAAALIRGHPRFRTNRMALVPRSVHVNPGVISGELGEQSPYPTAQLGFVAPTVAALKAFHLVDVTEYITPPDTVDVPMSQQNMSAAERREALRYPAFAHMLMVQPLESLTTVAGFAGADAEQVQHDARNSTITTTFGWQFPIAVRELVMVKGIERSPRPLGDFDATVCWRWRPLPAGELFAVGSDTFDRLPEQLWDDASPLENLRGQTIFFGSDLHAWLARLARRGDRWEVVLFASLDEDVSVERVCADP